MHNSTKLKDSSFTKLHLFIYQKWQSKAGSQVFKKQEPANIHPFLLKMKLLLTLQSIAFETITPLIPAALAVAQNWTAVYEVSERMVWFGLSKGWLGTTLIRV